MPNVPMVRLETASKTAQKVGAIDGEALDADAPTYHVQSVWDIGNVDMKEEVFRSRDPPGLTEMKVSGWRWYSGCNVSKQMRAV